MVIKMKLIITYNNEARKGFKSGWGFSCFIDVDNKKILFDTGDEPQGLLSNMTKLNINPEDIDIVVISHDHWDHTGGLNGLLEENKNQAYLINPADFSEPTNITESVYSTGPLKSFFGPVEQSLFIETKKGLIVIVGCSHPGVDKILNVAKKYGKIHAIIGGFHDFSELDALEGISLIGACHCTQHKQEIKERYPQQFREIRAGDVIEIQ